MSEDEIIKDDDLPNANLSDTIMDVGEEKTELDKIFAQLLDPKNIYHNTELTSDEITAFSTLGGMADKYDIRVLKKWLVDNMQMRVSRGRRGRNEIVKITARHMQEQDKKRGFLESLRRE